LYFIKNKLLEGWENLHSYNKWD